MIYVTGDTHADASRLSPSKLSRLSAGDTLIICGDFGFVWDGSAKEKKILKELGSRDYNICFIDGSHENFDLLNEYDISVWKHGKVHQLGGRLFHLMRGQIFRIEGQKIFVMGGGESPDIDTRYESEQWSRSEIPTQAQMYEGATNIEADNFNLDIIITHEPPSKTKGFLKLADNEPVRLTSLNAYFDELARGCKYKKWYFGSMHADKYVSETQIAVFKDIREAVSGDKI